MALDTRQEPREATSGSDVRERDQQRGIRNPQVEYKKQLEEEARERYEERTRRRVMSPGGELMPVENREPRVAPGSVPTRQQPDRAAEKAHAGTRPSVSEEFRERQYGNPYVRERNKEKAGDGSAVVVEQRRTEPQWQRTAQPSSKAAVKQSSGLARFQKMSRVAFATWVAVGACLPFYGYQLFWTIVSLFGWGIESDVIYLVDFLGVGNAVTRFIEGAFSALIPGTTLGLLGWVLATLMGIIQMVLTFCIYMLRGINPLQGSAPFTVFLLVLALYFLPIGLFPWVVLWMGSIIDHSRERK